MKILITGATGFIGSRLVRALVEKGYLCRCLVRETSNVDDINNLDNVELVYGDVTDPQSLKGIVRGIEVIYHLAGLMGHDSPSKKAFERFRRVNVEGTRNLLKECVGTDIRKIIHFSSTAAMGPVGANGPITETTACRPYTPYQVSKLESEEVARNFVERFNVPIVTIRPSMVYGPGFKGDFFTIAKVVKSRIFPLFGRGENLSPALYVDDLIEVIQQLPEKGKAGETYLITSERSYPLNRVVEIMESHLGIRTLKVPTPIWLAKTGAYLVEKSSALLGIKPVVTYKNICSTVTNRIFDVSKAKHELGFIQKIPLEIGLKNTLDWFLSRELF